MQGKNGSISSKRNLFKTGKITCEEAFQGLMKSCVYLGGIWRVLMKKVWGGATVGRSSTVKYVERLFEGAACENSVGLSLYGDPIETVEYIWVNIRCMFDWILSQNYRNKLPLNTVDQLVRSAKNETLLWMDGGEKMCENSNPFQRLYISLHNVVKRGFIYWKQN